MKQLKTTVFLAMLMSMVVLKASANFGVDGLTFELNDNTMEATLLGLNQNNKNSEIVIPSSITCNDKTYNVTGMRTTALKENSSITSVTIPSSIKKIPMRAFQSCYNLTTVNLPNTLTSIGEDAFSICYSLTSITLPSSLISIGGGAFADC